MSEEKKLKRTEYGYFGFSQIDNGIAQLYIRLKNFKSDELALYTYLYARKWNNEDKGDFKEGSCNMTKETIMAELGWGDSKLNRVINNLERYKLLKTEKHKRPRGGHEQTYYWPLEPVYDIKQFLDRYGDQLRDGQKEKLEEFAKQQIEKAKAMKKDTEGKQVMPSIVYESPISPADSSPTIHF